MSTFARIDFTFRVIVLILSMTIGLMFVVIGARNALAASLKPVALITGDVFTVGDLFGGLSKDVADKVLGPAPQPGRDMVLNARTLMRVAIALDLPWRPSSNADQITIRRAATLIETEDIKNALSTSLKNQGVSGRFDMTFMNIAQPEMIIPQNEPATIEISQITFDPQSERFQATLVAPSRQNPLTELMVSGQVEHLVPVPVLKEAISSGDVVNAYNIEWVDMKSRDLQSDIILNEQDLVGMTPRRVLLSGKPVRTIELERPQLISRGDTITITYNNGFMTLNAQGKSLQNGAKGDLIRVVNTSSNRTIEAFVEGESLVSVTQ